MALTVEDGSGLSNAEAYISVTDALAELVKLGETAFGALADTTAREVALRKATSYLDGRFALQFKGWAKTASQALKWPRAGVITQDGYALDPAVIPPKLKLANALLANLVALDVDLFVDELEGESGVTDSKIKVDVIEIAESFAGGKTTQPRFTQVMALLVDFLSTSGPILRR